MISVAMCTYNGEKYISEQLESILNQSVPVDEIIICDDNSTDNTLSIINRIIKGLSINIQIINNEHNQGVTRNFSNALSKCSGDIIFLSDQDDIWDIHKVERIVSIFEKNCSCQLVFTDAALIDSVGNILPKSLWENLGISIKDNYSINDFLGQRFVTGATVGLRKALLSSILPIPDCWIHDAWLAINAAVKYNGIIACADKLTFYRQHAENVIGVRNRTFIEHLIYTRAHICDSIVFRTIMKKRFISFFYRNEKYLSKNEQENLLRCINFWSDTELIHNKSIFYGIRVIVKHYLNGNYKKYNHSIYGVLVDIFIMLSKKTIC